MKRYILLTLCCAVLGACAANGSGNTEMYGQISTGVESSKTF